MISFCKQIAIIVIFISIPPFVKLTVYF